MLGIYASDSFVWKERRMYSDDLNPLIQSPRLSQTNLRERLSPKPKTQNPSQAPNKSPETQASFQRHPEKQALSGVHTRTQRLRQTKAKREREEKRRRSPGLLAKEGARQQGKGNTTMQQDGCFPRFSRPAQDRGSSSFEHTHVDPPLPVAFA